MIIEQPKVEIEKFDGIKIMKNIERACRTCYRSEGSITEDSYKKLINNCISRGHESVLEHEKITVRLRCDVGVYKDLTRHRVASFSIESTRYCAYNKDKFEGQLHFIEPCNIEKGVMYSIWKNEMQNIEHAYQQMAYINALPDQMRMILPHSTAADVTMTCNIREWKHILELRTTKFVHPAVQQVMIPLLLEFKKQMPEIFSSVEYNTEFPKEKYAAVEYL